MTGSHGRPPSPGPAGSWEDKVIWTGSIFDHDGAYHLYCSALSHAEEGHRQRIGLATSTDLESWTRYPANPVYEADLRWYRKRGPAPWGSEVCRDPWVGADPEHGGFLMLYTATASEGPNDAAGVIGAARSTDLVDWEAIPPVTGTAKHRDLVVAQPVRIGDRWHLLSCTRWHSEARVARTGPAGTWHGAHYLVSDSLSGPYLLTRDGPLAGDLVFLAWRRWADDGSFAGAISNPAGLHVDAASHLPDRQRPILAR